MAYKAVKKSLENTKYKTLSCHVIYLYNIRKLEMQNMAKSENQKLKILYIIDILKRYTDENHLITTREIIQRLEAYDIKAERKSIYNDIETLRKYGYEIILSKSPMGYYLADYVFELPELKMLVDAVCASKFLSEKKSQQLIKKLENFTSKYEAKRLERQVYVADRVKTVNENIYYNVDNIHEAIQENVKIKFKYLEWNDKKNLVLKKNGSEYLVSPISLVWNDENYYLVAYEEIEKNIKHYRVDKMKDIVLLEEKRSDESEHIKFDPAKFSKKTFGMYGGENIKIGLEFPKHMIGVMLDRFGNDIPVIKTDEDRYKTTVDVVKSSQFFGWLTGLGRGVRLLGDEAVLNEYKKYLEDILKEY